MTIGVKVRTGRATPTGTDELRFPERFKRLCINLVERVFRRHSLKDNLFAIRRKIAFSGLTVRISRGPEGGAVVRRLPPPEAIFAVNMCIIGQAHYSGQAGIKIGASDLARHYVYRRFGHFCYFSSAAIVKH